MTPELPQSTVAELLLPASTVAQLRKGEITGLIQIHRDIGSISDVEIVGAKRTRLVAFNLFLGVNMASAAVALDAIIRLGFGLSHAETDANDALILSCAVRSADLREMGRSGQ